MDTAKQHAVVTIRASVLIVQLGFNPEVLATLILQELRSGEAERRAGR